MSLPEKLDRQVFSEVVKSLGEYYKYKPTKSDVSIMWNACKHLTREDFEAASARVLMTCKFWPRLAEWVSILKPAQDEVLASEAAMLVDKAVEDYGVYASPIFPVAVANAIEDIGGWEMICNATTEEWFRFKRKEFQRAFLARMKSQTTRPGETRKVLGVGEKTGMVGEFEVKPELPKGEKECKAITE